MVPGVSRDVTEESESEMGESTPGVSLTEDDLQFFKDSLKNQREERHGRLAISIAQSKGLFIDKSKEWNC